MVDYGERLAEAMKAATPKPVSITELARALGISYQAVRKVLQGGRFGTENNAAAAKRLGVRSDWLATGKGPRHEGAQNVQPAMEREPYEQQLLADLEDIPPPRRDALLSQIHRAAEEAREAAAHFDARRFRRQATRGSETVVADRDAALPPVTPADRQTYARMHDDDKDASSGDEEKVKHDA